MQLGQTWVHSDTLGMIRYKSGNVDLAPPSEQYPYFTNLLNVWMQEQIPVDFPCTSISVNKNYAGVTHRDAFNAGPSALLAVGSF